MIRQKNNLLVLIVQHEICDVLLSSLAFLVPHIQEALRHVVWVRYRDLREFLLLHQ